jgi:hypothetical protein
MTGNVTVGEWSRYVLPSNLDDSVAEMREGREVDKSFNRKKSSS